MDDIKRTAILKTQTIQQSAENLRKEFVNDMAWGKMLIINMAMMNARPEYYRHETFPLEACFNSNSFLDRKTKAYKKLLREEEDVDKFGTKGCFHMTDGFGLGFITNISDEHMDDEIVEEIMANIPCIG